MGCSSSSSATSDGDSALGRQPAQNGTTPKPPKVKGGDAEMDSIDGPRPHAKSLSTYNKTKGGSMLFNLSSRSHIDPDDADISDDQHIMSPAEPDWKLGKALKRAPPMKSTHYFPIKIKGDDNRKVTAAVGYTTLQGKNPKPPHKPNQDSLSVFSVKGYSNLAMFSVFDGHGPFGEHASHFCRSVLHQAFLKNSKEVIEQDPKLALETAIFDVHTRFCSDASIKAGVDPVVSGTTLVSLLLDGTRLYAANVGDSRAILGTMGEDHTLKVVELTDDHKPQRDDERKRLEENNAILLTEREIRGFGDEGKIYICREKAGDIIYGVLFTRSIGDLDSHENLGISAKPEILIRDLTPDDRYLVIASDGIWDYMSNEEVLNIVGAIKDPLKASEEIVKVAKELWDSKDEDGRRDDITVMVVKLEITEKPQATDALTDISPGSTEAKAPTAANNDLSDLPVDVNVDE